MKQVRVEFERFIFNRHNKMAVIKINKNRWNRKFHYSKRRCKFTFFKIKNNPLSGPLFSLKPLLLLPEFFLFPVKCWVGATRLQFWPSFDWEKAPALQTMGGWSLSRWGEPGEVDWRFLCGRGPPGTQLTTIHKKSIACIQLTDPTASLDLPPQQQPCVDLCIS